jgi:hypothetical protein
MRYVVFGSGPLTVLGGVEVKTFLFLLPVLRIRIKIRIRIRMFLGLLDPDPVLLSTSKNSKKNLDSTKCHGSATLPAPASFHDETAIFLKYLFLFFFSIFTDC